MKGSLICFITTGMPNSHMYLLQEQIEQHGIDTWCCSAHFLVVWCRGETPELCVSLCSHEQDGWKQTCRRQWVSRCWRVPSARHTPWWLRSRARPIDTFSCCAWKMEVSRKNEARGWAECWILLQLHWSQDNVLVRRVYRNTAIGGSCEQQATGKCWTTKLLGFWWLCHVEEKKLALLVSHLSSG